MPEPVIESYRFHTFRLDPSDHVLYNGDQPVSITPKAFKTLLVLLQNQGRLVTKEELLQQVWPDSFVEENSLTQNIWMLRRVLGQQPEGPTFIETVPKYGYRFVADVSTPAIDNEFEPRMEELTELHADPVAAGTRPAGGHMSIWWAVPAALLVTGILVYLSTGRSSFSNSRLAVAVIQFKNLSGEADADWLSTALEEMFTTELGAGSRLRMISSDSIARQMEADAGALSADGLGKKETLARIHNNLECDLVVTGSYLRIAGKLRVDIRLQNAVSGETIDSLSQIDGEADLFSLVSAAGARLRAKLGVPQPSPGQQESVRAAAAGNPEAARLYAEGLARLRQFDAITGQTLLASAVTADPQFPLAHSALSAAWSQLGYDEKAKSEAKLAFDLSGHLSHEDGLLIEGRYRQAGSDWTKAISVYQTLWGFFPDNLEYGLLLATAQTSGGQGKPALDVIKSLHGLKSAAADARIDIAEARIAEALADYRRGLNTAQNAVRLAQAQGARSLEASARLEEGKCLLRLTEPAKARQTFETVRGVCSSIGDRGCVAEAMNDEGAVVRSQGDLDRAAAFFRDALAIEREIGDRRATSKSLISLANVLRSRADMEGARELYEQALAIGREVSDKRGVTLSLISIGNVLNNTGHPEPAKQRYREALNIARETGDRNQITIAMGNLAILAYTEGDLSGAKKSLEEVLDLKRQIADRSSYAYTLSHYGNVLLAQGDIAGTRKAWKEQCQIQSQAGEKIVLANCELALAQLDMLEGKPESVEAPARRVGAAFTTVNPSADAWNLLAEASLMRGDLKQADEASRNATRIAQKSPNVADYRLPIAITAARVAAALGHSTEALRSLEDSLIQTNKLNLVGLQLQTRYAICEVRKDRREIAKLIQDADQRGYKLVVSKANHLLPPER